MIITDPKIWDDFIASRPHAPLLQSWAWGEFNEQLGIKVVRLGLEEGSQITAAAQCLIIPRKLGRQLYVPHGPVTNWNNGQLIGRILSEIYQLAKEERCDYIRIEPLQEYSDQLIQKLESNKYRSGASFVQQEAGWLLDLLPTEEELLAGMRKSTRYEVKQSEKQAVMVEVSSDPTRINEFFKLLRQTVFRQGFAAQSESYLSKQFTSLASRGLEKLYLASYEGKVLAAAIIGLYGDSASYLHGASIRSDISAAYGLQWQVIKDVKQSGYKLYDFWGVAPNDNPKHPWAGLSLFKRGFGGYPVRYVSAWDYPLTYRYHLIALLEHIRKMRRGQS